MRIAIVAGEASGDWLASHLMRALRHHHPEIEFFGIGGPKMAAEGMQVLYPLEKLAVRGYVEVLRHYREIVSIRSRLQRHLLRQRPDLFIGVDAPDFNLKLETRLRRAGIPVVHYVSPSIWAWRKERIRAIGRAVDHMLVLFPFEKPLYDQAGIAATYVGHPMADHFPEQVDRSAARERLHLPATGPVIALLPGSRQSELQALADLFVATAGHLASRYPQARFLVPLVSRETRQLFEAALYRQGNPDFEVTILFGHAHEALMAADVALVASGTATLEAALLKCPMVITYRMPALSWHIIRRKKYQPYVGLPNILSGRFVVPELLQHDATADNLAQAISNLLDDKVVAAGLERHFTAMHRTLKCDTAATAAAAILPYLRSGHRT